MTCCEDMGLLLLLASDGNDTPKRGERRELAMTISGPVVANGRTYSVPSVCAIAICLDGCEPAYLEVAISEGLMPNPQRMRETGTDRLAHSVIPSFTNPTNPANPDATTGAVAVNEASGQGGSF